MSMQNSPSLMTGSLSMLDIEGDSFTLVTGSLQLYSYCRREFPSVVVTSGDVCRADIN